jgi:ABC-type uncharacterized transport system substrate-binding protein
LERLSLLNKLILFLFLTGAAMAHPHVTVDYKVTVVILEGKVTAVKHFWTFDALYSAYVLAGQGDKKDGKPTEAEFKKLATANVENLDEFGYFSSASLNKVKLAFDKPRDENMGLENNALTLSFTLPLRSPPVIGKEEFKLDVYDPTFFVSFQPGSGEFIKVEGQGCKSDYKPPAKPSTSSLSKLGESFFDNLSKDFAKDYTSSMVVSCQ